MTRGSNNDHSGAIKSMNKSNMIVLGSAAGHSYV